MAWERRGNAPYYTAERVGGRVVKQYVGTGPAAELAAELDAVRQQERSEAAEREARERDQMAALEAVLTPLNELADALGTAALVAAGYHRPKRGPWRRRCA
jgi:hypothetical protein